MGFFDYIFKPRKRESNLNIVQSTPVAFGGGSSSVCVTGDFALEVTAYKRALDVLAGSVARLPLEYLKRQGGIYVEDEKSSYHYLLSVEPQQRMNAYDFKYQLVWRALHDGNAYVYPRVLDGKAEASELVLLSRGSVSFDEINCKYHVSDTYNGVYGVFEESEILHFSFNSTDGRKGIPLWMQGQRSLSIIATGDKETLERFDKGGKVRGIISNDKTGLRGLGEYQDQELARLAKSTDDMFKAGECIVAMPGAAGMTVISSTSADMQFLESRKFAVSDIARLTGVPLSFLGEGTGSNYKAPEQEMTVFLTQTLDRILKAIECEFQRKLVPPSFCCKRRFQFDRRKIYSMDLGSMANYEAKMIQNGVFTVNDVRKMENQAPIEHGDTVYLSTNLAEIGSEKLSGKAPAPETTETTENEEI